MECPLRCTMRSGRRGLFATTRPALFVAKIHRIAKQASEEGRTPLVAGDKAHPEVALQGHGRQVFIFADLAELEAWPRAKMAKMGYCGGTNHVSGNKMVRMQAL